MLWASAEERLWLDAFALYLAVQAPDEFLVVFRVMNGGEHCVRVSGYDRRVARRPAPVPA